MRALTAAGDAGGALAVYRAAREALTGEPGVPPSEEMEQLRARPPLPVVGSRTPAPRRKQFGKIS